MYAQKIEGKAWKGEMLDSGKIDKMSGKLGWPWWFPALEGAWADEAGGQISNWANFMSLCRLFRRKRGRGMMKVGYYDI